MITSKWVCAHCEKVCKSERGLNQHTLQVKRCREAERASLSVRRPLQQDCHPSAAGLRRSTRTKRKVQAGAENPPAHGAESGGNLDPETWDEDEENEAELSQEDGYEGGREDEDGGIYGTESDDEGPKTGTTLQGDCPSKRRKLDDFRSYCTNHSMQHLPRLRKEVVTSIKLMDALKRKKAPLNAFPELLQWHLRETGHLLEHETLKDTSKYEHRQTLLKKLTPRYHMEGMFPKIKRVTLPSSKARVGIPYRNAEDCVVSLLTDPHATDSDFLYHGGSPWAPPPETITHIGDLNTGDAYLKTHEKLITRKGQVLVMVPMYIDGATTGQFSDLPVTPLKISLGIFTQAAREKAWAWRTIGWIPQVRKANSRGKKLFAESKHLESLDVVVVDGEGETASESESDEDGDAEDLREGKRNEDEDSGDEGKDTEVKAQDFHTMIHTILEASGFLKLQKKGMIWDLVYKGSCYRDSELVFVVPFVKADTEEADLHCGKYLSRTKNVKHGCRYCHCPMDKMDDPRARYRHKNQEDIKKLVDNENLDGLKAISQQHIQNAWYKVQFHQANTRGIHGACPSEMLHALLLGIFRYVRDVFFEMVGKDSAMAEDMNGLAKMYGVLLSHQSERDLPKADFTKGIKRGKLMATQYRGVLLLMAAILRSDIGRKMLQKKKKFRKVGIQRWAHLVELLLQWEAYLCQREMRKDLVKKMERKHRYIMFLMTQVAQREEGMGLKLMKFHAIVHLVTDILLYGVPKEYDTGANESHHKPTKQAAKLTQRKESTFNFQTAVRLAEFLLLDLAMAEVGDGVRVWEYFDRVIDKFPHDAEGDAKDLHQDADPLDGESTAEDADADEQDADADANPKKVHTGGTRIRIFSDSEEDGEPTFEVLGRSKSRKKTVWVSEVVDFLYQLQQEVLEYIPQQELPVLTEHRRDQVCWRAHPNFQGRGPWKDWVLVDWGPEGVLPCHIWCFVDLTGLDSGTKRLEIGGVTLKPNVCAVVESSTHDDDEEDIAKSEIFIPLTLDVEGIDEENNVTGREFYLADVEAFKGPCAVIPNIGGKPNAYFQVKPREDWIGLFEDWLKTPHKDDQMEE